MKQDILEDLFAIIKERKHASPETSYVSSLYEKGTAKIAQKVGEEAIETCIEAVQGNTEKLKEESADLLFHLMVLWADTDISPDDVLTVLEKRMGTNGHNEKASRYQ
jgi:phosphoribosyl-ATP pyrophosphohydrolase